MAGRTGDDEKRPKVAISYEAYAIAAIPSRKKRMLAHRNGLRKRPTLRRNCSWGVSTRRLRRMKVRSLRVTSRTLPKLAASHWRTASARAASYVHTASQMHCTL